MSDLYLVRAQPNPPGRDAAYPGVTTNAKLNEEWVEFVVLQNRQMVNDELLHLTFDGYCHRTGTDAVFRFGSLTLHAQQRVRVHTGSGSAGWVGDTLHVYAGRNWFVWNNACGDRATLAYNGGVIDSAYYGPNPPEGILVREQGTDRLVPSPSAVFRR